MTPDDRDLVRRCLAGEADGLEGLLDRYERPIFNLALRMVGNREDASDVTQTVFVKAYARLRNFDQSKKFFSWLYRIGVNESLDCLGRRRPTDTRDLDTLDAPGDGPDDDIESSERSRAVRRALMRLGTEHRTVIVLRHYHEQSYAEIAQVLGLPEKTVKSRLFSARQRLKGLLAGSMESN